MIPIQELPEPVDLSEMTDSEAAAVLLAEVFNLLNMDSEAAANWLEFVAKDIRANGFADFETVGTA